MFEGFSPLTQTLFGTGLTWLVTAIGASLCALHTKNSKGDTHVSFMKVKTVGLNIVTCGVLCVLTLRPGAFWKVLGIIFNLDSVSLTHLLLDGSLGFSAGVMLAASFWSLLDPALSMAKDDLDWGAVAVFPVTVGLILGAAFVGSASYFLPIDWLTPLLAPVVYSGNIEGRYLSQQASPTATCSVSHDGMEVVRKLRKKSSPNGDGETVNGGIADAYRLDVSHSNHCRLSDLTPRFVMNRRLWLLIIAVTVHNIPEGLAVGIAFGGIGHHARSTLANARNLAIGIAIQNFPEGLAVSLPLNAAGCGFAKSFFLGQLSGLVEPVAGILGCIAVQFFRRLQPYALGFAAGAMLFVVFDDVIPEAQH
ncbi:metal cation transporter, ZIP family, partial [Opisthorchis viverrini]